MMVSKYSCFEGSVLFFSQFNEMLSIFENWIMDIGITFIYKFVWEAPKESMRIIADFCQSHERI